MSAFALAAVAVLVVTLVTGSSPKVGPLTANQDGQNGSAATLPTYTGQQQRSVFQTIDRIVASGQTMVTTGIARPATA